VFNTLRKAILTGQLKPGDRLMEVHLANKLGVSRTPIREAIHKLEQEGLVTMVPRRGAEVAKITERSLQDVLEVRRALDVLSVELACERISEDKLEQLKKRKEAYEDEGRALREDTLNIMDIIENKEALLRMDEFIADQQLNVKRAEDRMEEARLALQTAMQESKTQDKLREKAFEQFMKDENARESKEIDELVSYTYGRKA